MHLVSGQVAAVAALMSWGVILTRRTGTGAGLLFPWISVRRLGALRCDFRRHVHGLRHQLLPPYDEANPLTAALHGLGLVLVTAMGVTGFACDLAEDDGFQGAGAVLYATGLHQVMEDLVWVYLLTHGLMALVHHYGLDTGLGEMWSLGRSTDNEGHEKWVFP